VLTDLITDESKIPAIENIKDRSELLANAMEALGEASSHAQESGELLDFHNPPCCPEGKSCK
jgi:predicted RNase H-like HicB family nuclease